MSRFAVLLMTFFCLASTAWSQSVRLVFQDAPLSSVLQTVDQYFPDTRIHYVVDDVEPYLITATIEQPTAVDALNELLKDISLVINIEGKDIFIGRQRNHKITPNSTLLTPHSSDAISSYYLDEVLVIDHQPTFSLSNPSLTLQVNGTDLMHRGSAADLLSYLPGVQYQSGTVRMNDQSLPLIYIDDSPVSSFTEVMALRSEEINSISLLDAAGTTFPSQGGAVIQIYTNAPRKGWNVQALASVSVGNYVSHQENMKIGWNSDRLHLTSGIVYSDNNSYQEHNTSSGDFVYSPRVRALNPYLQGSFRLNEQQQLGIRYELLNVLNDVYYLSNLITISNNSYFNSLDIEGLKQQNEWTLSYAPRHNARVYYTGLWSKAQVRLDAEYYRDALKIDSEEYLYKEEDKNLNLIESRNTNDISNNLLNERLEVSFPFSKGTISLGNEFAITRREDSYNRDSRFDLSALRKENQLSFFISGEYRFANNLRLRGGLRNELLKSDYSRTGTHKRYARNFLLPSIEAMIPLSSTQLKLSYLANTYRPSYSQLNGYTRYNQYMMYVSGNPDLRPALNHIFSVQLQLSDLYLSLRYRHIKDYVAHTIHRNEGSYLMDYYNLPTANDLYFTVSYSPKIKGWSPIVTASLLSQYLTLSFNDGSVKELNRPVFFVDIHCPFNILSATQCWIDYHFHSTGNIGSSLQRYRGVLDIGISHQLGHFIFRCQAEDLLNTGDSFFESYGQSIVYRHKVHSDSRRISLSLSMILP